VPRQQAFAPCPSWVGCRSRVIRVESRAGRVPALGGRVQPVGERVLTR